LGLGESYCESLINVKDEDYIHFVNIFVRIAKSPKKAKILRKLSILDKLQILKARFGYFLKIKGGLETKGSRKKDINTHYSLDEWFDNDEDSNKFYMYWLKSPYVQYTCARWDPEIKTLDQAQKNKFEYYAKRMGITKASKGKTIADLGCGWGGVSFYFAEKFGVHCTCITLSTAQAKYIKAEVKKRKLSKLITVVLDDAHNLSGSFDHIISVGMLEHIREFDAFTKQYQRL
ncbi:MAG: cyclopropane fatty-acyl-phospholipid synthase-like methyltransferase, partial [Candidatus Woesearchaeota archaeon]